MKFPHKVKVSRVLDTVVDRDLSDPDEVEVYSSMRCLVEPLSAERKGSLIGVYERTKFLISYPSSFKVQPGDFVAFDGNRYILTDIREDSFRVRSRVPRYCVANLDEIP